MKFTTGAIKPLFLWRNEMPFDSQGNFTRVMNWQEDAANSIPILASRHDDEDDNFANGFNEVMCRDGRTQMTGQLKMGSNKIVGVATGTASTDAVNKGQLDSALAGAVADKQNTITGGASSITSSNLTINRVLISNGSGKVAVSAVTSTELGYLDGVTSNVQTQLNNNNFVKISGATNIKSSLAFDRSYTFTKSGFFVLTIKVSSQTGPTVVIHMTDSGSASSSSQVVGSFGTNGGSAEYQQCPFSFPIKTGQSIYLQTQGTGGKEIISAYIFAWE